MLNFTGWQLYIYAAHPVSPFSPFCTTDGIAGHLIHAAIIVQSSFANQRFCGFCLHIDPPLDEFLPPLSSMQSFAFNPVSLLIIVASLCPSTEFIRTGISLTEGAVDLVIEAWLTAPPSSSLHTAWEQFNIIF